MLFVFAVWSRRFEHVGELFAGGRDLLFQLLGRVACDQRVELGEQTRGLE
jgi:hypothetical protein